MKTSGLLNAAVVLWLATNAEAGLFNYVAAYRNLYADNLNNHGTPGYQPYSAPSGLLGAYIHQADVSLAADRTSVFQDSHLADGYISARGAAQCELISGSAGGRAETFVQTQFLITAPLPNSSINALLSVPSEFASACSGYIHIRGPGIEYDSLSHGDIFSWSGTLQAGIYEMVASVVAELPYEGWIGRTFHVSIVPSPGAGTIIIAMIGGVLGRRRRCP
jgi:hypothetical protein